MEAAALEVITISDFEKDEEEDKYLKIYYPNSSTKRVEVPLADDGSLSFIYIKAMIPDIFALNLMKDEISRLYLPTNDCFKEPKEKWNSFRVIAVLKDSNSTTASSSNNNVSTRTDSTDKLQLPTASTTDGTSINNEPSTSTAVSAANKTPQTSGTSFQDKNAAATKEQHTVPPPQPIDPSLPSSSVQSISKDATNDSNSTASSSNNNASPRTNSTDNLRSRTMFTTADPSLINNEPTTSTTISVANKLPQASGTSSQVRIATTDVQNIVLPPPPIDPFLPSSSVQSTNNSAYINESLPPANVNGAVENQLQNLSCGPHGRQIKKEACDSSSEFGDEEEMESTSASSSCDRTDIKEIKKELLPKSDAQVFAAYGVTTIQQLKELLCPGNPKFIDHFDNIYCNLKRTMIAFPNKEIVKLFYYASFSFLRVKALNPCATEICEICNQRFTISHLVSRGHVTKHQSKYNKDPPEISLILDSKNRAHIITPALLKAEGENPLEFCINKFYPKKQFDETKRHLSYRIRKAQLSLPCYDPFLIEKLIFIRNAKLHRIVKNLFPQRCACKNCEIEFKQLQFPVVHILGGKHLRHALTQAELDNLIEAVSAVDYSDADGFFYTPLNESRKRNHQKSTSYSNAAAKRQRNN